MKFVISDRIPKPHVFDEVDAARKLKRLEEELTEADLLEVFSIRGYVLDEIRGLREKAQCVRNVPFIFGSYEVSPGEQRRKFVFADLTSYDVLVFPSLLFIGPVSALGSVIPRALYFAGRRQWWRHECYHVVHHLTAMEYLLKRMVREGEEIPPDLDAKLYEDAFYYVHENGIEEPLTRWQSLKEGVGIREKLSGGFSLYLYLHYLPFTGLRNYFTEVKRKIVRFFSRLRIPKALKTLLKYTTYGALLASPVSLAIYSTLLYPKFVPGGGEAMEVYKTHIEGLNFWEYLAYEVVPAMLGLGSILPGLPLNTVFHIRILQLIGRVAAYTTGAMVSAILSPKKKGISRWEKERVNTYKFPYTYNPVKALSRGIKLLLYLRKVYDLLPKRTELTNETEGRNFLEQMKGKLRRLTQRERDLTMRVLEDMVEDHLRLLGTDLTKFYRMAHNPITNEIVSGEIYPKNLFLAYLPAYLKSFFT